MIVLLHSYEGVVKLSSKVWEDSVSKVIRRYPVTLPFGDLLTGIETGDLCNGAVSTNTA